MNYFYSDYIYSKLLGYKIRADPFINIYNDSGLYLYFAIKVPLGTAIIYPNSLNLSTT